MAPQSQVRGPGARVERGRLARATVVARADGSQAHGAQPALTARLLVERELARLLSVGGRRDGCSVPEFVPAALRNANGPVESGALKGRFRW